MSTPDNQKTASDRGASSGHNPLTIPRVGAHLIEGAGPAADLDGVWELLDVLPRIAAKPSLTASTIEMVAISVSGASLRGGSTRRGASSTTQNKPAWNGSRADILAASWHASKWVAASATVVSSLLVGALIGRATAPNPDNRVLEYLPVAQSLELLAEAGSLDFLQQLANRRYPPPRRLGPGLPPAGIEYRELDAAVESFDSLRVGNQADTAVVAKRREEVEALSAMDRRELERRVEKFQKLSVGSRRDIVELAKALGEGDRSELLDAARLWHQWIGSRDPADRQDIIDLNTKGRLEWLERHARFDGRPGDRPPRDRDGDRDPRRFPPPPGQRPRWPGGPVGPGGGPPGGPKMENKAARHSPHIKEQEQLLHIQG